MSFSVQACVAPDHPSLPGHFPGEPIVPGVLLIEEVLAALHQWRGPIRVKGLPQVKFSSPLRPGVRFDIHLDATAPERYRFQCRVQAAPVAGGLIEVVQDETGGA